MRYHLNLCAGLEKIGVPYTVNDFRAARKHPDLLLGIVGKPHLLTEPRLRNPVLFGPAVFSHPLDQPDFFETTPVRKVLLSCEWLKRMWSEILPADRLEVWPSGVDTDRWQPSPVAKDIDVLIYDKVRWNYPEMTASLIAPIRQALEARGLKTETVRYGFYKEEDFERLLTRCRSMIFLCEHETQGFAYLQTLASGVPILAWDDEGYWRDPEFYPQRVRFQPISSVPYWDSRCGVKFRGPGDFAARLDEFLGKLDRQDFAPREYVLENLTLARCAERYVEHYRRTQAAAR